MTSFKTVPQSGKGEEWVGGSKEGVSVCSEAVRLAEQQALANIGESLSQIIALLNNQCWYLSP